MFEKIQTIEDLSLAYSNLRVLGVSPEEYNEDYNIARDRILRSNTKSASHLPKYFFKKRKKQVYTAKLSVNPTNAENEMELL